VQASLPQPNGDRHRILLINQYAGSPSLGMEFRPSAFAREWERMGHRTLVVAGAPSHLRAHNPDLQEKVTSESVDGIDFEWYRLPSYDGNGVRRAINIVTFAARLRARRRALARALAPDIVIASSTHPLDIYGARWIAKRCGARLVFEVHDLWPQTPIELGGVSPRNPFIIAMSRAERYACRHADLVVSILPSTDEYLVTRGLDRARFVHIPNGISAETLTGQAEALPAAHAELIASLRANGAFIVGYTGGIGMANALDDLLTAMTLVRDRQIAVLLWGDGPDRAALEERIRSEAIANVHLLGRIPRTAVGSALAACDAAFLGWKRLGIYRYGVSPNKLWDYMAAARPIVHATSAPGDPVAACGCGVSVPAEDPQALADALADLASRPAEELAEMGRRGRANVEQNNDYSVLAARFLAAVERSGR
jgi:glycosyltransferase involved in cell wall biosynthesis